MVSSRFAAWRKLAADKSESWVAEQSFDNDSTSAFDRRVDLRRGKLTNTNHQMRGPFMEQRELKTSQRNVAGDTPIRAVVQSRV